MSQNQILLVEGKDDLLVLSNIFKIQKIKECFSIENKQGIENLIKSIPIHIKTDIETIGIVVDADTEIRRRWQSIHEILNKTGYKNIPNKIDKKGLIADDENLPRIGVWLMPDNEQDGLLEDFVKQLIKEKDKLLPYVEEALEKIEKLELNKYADVHKSKAKIHTWLSWQENPGTPMGLAITKKYLTTNNELCNTFLNWIKDLFYGQ